MWQKCLWWYWNQKVKATLHICCRADRLAFHSMDSLYDSLEEECCSIRFPNWQSVQSLGPGHYPVCYNRYFTSHLYILCRWIYRMWAIFKKLCNSRHIHQYLGISVPDHGGAHIVFQGLACWIPNYEEISQRSLRYSRQCQKRV